MINEERERHEIESLLPWYAAGTLGRRDAERVERALAADGELAQRYELVREELAETIALNEKLGAPSARAVEKLFAAIDAEETRAARTRHHRSSGHRVWRWPRPKLCAQPRGCLRNAPQAEDCPVGSIRNRHIFGMPAPNPPPPPAWRPHGSGSLT